MACSTSPCNLAGAWTHSACKDGSIHSTAPPPGCPRVGCCGSSLSENRPCRRRPLLLDAPSTWAHHNQFTLFLLRFDHSCNIPAVLDLVGGLYPHPLLPVVGQSL